MNRFCKKISLATLALIVSLPALAQQRIDIGNLFFSFSSKPFIGNEAITDPSQSFFNEGSITDFSIGYDWKNKTTSELRARLTNLSKTSEFSDLSDSLNVANNNFSEFFLLPFEYSFINNPPNRLYAELGLYYEYSSTKEKGFFDMPQLEMVGMERVNAYTNDSSMHIAGPLIGAGFRIQKPQFDGTVSLGVVPIFLLISEQTTGIKPLLPDTVSHIQTTSGSPYFYAGVNGIFFRRVFLNVTYDFSRLDYDVIDFNASLAFALSPRTVMTHSLHLEAAVLIPLGGDLYIQIGGGMKLDYTQLDSAPPIHDPDTFYLIFTTKKLSSTPTVPQEKVR